MPERDRQDRGDQLEGRVGPEPLVAGDADLEANALIDRNAEAKLAVRAEQRLAVLEPIGKFGVVAVETNAGGG